MSRSERRLENLSIEPLEEVLGFESSDHYKTPEQTLICALLHRAALDFHGISLAAQKHWQKEARRFIFSNSLRDFGFVFCCWHLGLDPKAFRKSLLGAGDRLRRIARKSHTYKSIASIRASYAA